MTADGAQPGATEYRFRYRLMGWGRLTSDATNHSHFLHFCKPKKPMPVSVLVLDPATVGVGVGVGVHDMFRDMFAY